MVVEGELLYTYTYLAKEIYKALVFGRVVILGDVNGASVVSGSRVRITQVSE